MKPLIRKRYQAGEMWIGPASFDPSQTAIKYAYAGRDGRISRGSPEVSIDLLADMVMFAAEQGQFNEKQKNIIVTVISESQ
jgi:hypothetical protein